MSVDKKAQPYRVRKAGKRVLIGETREEEAARLEKGHPPRDTVQTWRAQSFLIAAGLEQQAAHSDFRAENCRGNRQEDDAERMSGRLAIVGRGERDLDGRLNAPEANLPLAGDPRALAQSLAAYREPSSPRSIFEIAITALPLALLWLLMWTSLEIGYWACLLLSVPAAGFLVRLFMIQHDCGHGAFFRQRVVNNWVGRVIGVVTLTPYDFWRRTHAIHHAHSGNLDHRGIGDIDMLTVREYLALSPWRRLRYRLYRHPLIMFGVGPAYHFVLRQRLPFGLMRSGWEPWLSTMATNVAIAALFATMIWLVGVGPFLLVQLPITLLGASIGVWLFYVQHQFEDTFWTHDKGWNFHEAALRGSSHYDLPQVLRWFTANIGVHHVHHLCSRIPYYRLPLVLRDHPQLAAVGRLTLLQSFRCVHMVLWDEVRQRAISFRDIHVIARAPRACPS